jgi:hypothetical protein
MVPRCTGSSTGLPVALSVVPALREAADGYSGAHLVPVDDLTRPRGVAALASPSRGRRFEGPYFWARAARRSRELTGELLRERPRKGTRCRDSSECTKRLWRRVHPPVRLWPRIKGVKPDQRPHLGQIGQQPGEPFRNPCGLIAAPFG